MIWPWTLLVLLMVLLLGLDLFLLNRRPSRVSPPEALAWALFWFALAGAFNGALWFACESDFLGLRSGTGVQPDDASQQFLASLLTEAALGLDSILVMSAIFAHRKTPEDVQHRVLVYGLLVALPLRGLVIGAVGAAVSRWDWARIVFGGLLILATLRMLIVRQENTDPDKNLFVRLTQKVLPAGQSEAGTRLLTRQNGRWVWTPLLAVLLLVETADLVFALDSIPAAFAMTASPFIVFAANGFALLCVRSLFFALRDRGPSLRYLKLGLAAILAYCAVVISFPDDLRPDTRHSLAFITSALVAGVGLALIFARPGPMPTVSPLGPDAERIARLTLRQARKLIVLVVGFTVLAIGIFMLVGPGPGLLVVPIGLAVLASEFLWAKRLLNHYTQRAAKMGKRAGDALVKRSHPWLIVPVIGGTIAGIWLIVHLGWMTPAVLIPSSIPLFIGQLVWAVLTIQRYRRHKRAAPVEGIKARAEPPSESSAA